MSLLCTLVRWIRVNDPGVDGKSWFQEQGPLWVHGRGYRVFSPFLLRFSECTMSHVPPSPSPGNKRRKNPCLYVLSHLEFSDPYKNFTGCSLTLINSFSFLKIGSYHSKNRVSGLGKCLRFLGLKTIFGVKKQFKKG